MKLKNLKKLIREQIKKLHEQDLNPDQDCSEETGLFAGYSDYLITKTCNMCEYESGINTEPNEYGFYVDLNECFCCKDYDWEDNEDDDNIDNVKSTQVHWFGGGCGDIGLGMNSDEEIGAMCLAWSAIPVDTLGNQWLPPVDNNFQSDLDECAAGAPDSDPYCSISTELFWELAGSPNVGDMVHFSNSNNSFCMRYQGTTNNFNSVPDVCSLNLGWGDGSGYNPLYNSGGSLSITTCDSIECGGKGEEPDPPKDCENPESINTFPFSAPINGFNSAEDFCTRCEEAYEMTQSWAQQNNLPSCDSCEHLESEISPQISRMQKLANIKK